MGILGEFTSSQLATWGAITGSVGLLISLTLAFFQIRKALREAPKLRIDRTSAGATFSGAHRWDNITAFAINEGGATVSVTNYGVEVYETKIGWLLRRPTRRVRGDGFELRVVGDRVGSALPDGKSPPFAIKSGEPMRLDVYDHGFWPDRNWRRVYFMVRYAPPRAVARLRVDPQDHNFSDPASVEASRQRMAEAIARQLES